MAKPDLSTLHIVRPSRPVDEAQARINRGEEFALVRMEAEISVLKAEIQLWRERCLYKNEMLEDEASWLQEILDTEEPQMREALKRRMSRLRGAAHRYEKAKL